MYKDFLKRVLDLVFAVIGFVVLLPIILPVYIALLIANDGKPLFIQSRAGKDGKLFNIIKFKTMNDRRDELGNLLSDAQRLTRVGAFIRKTSIDELPQLINVVKGNMSLVGPRPLLPEYLPLYNDFQRRRHEVRPGITGWAQVNGRNAISWEEKFKLDVYYVENCSFWMDVKILFLTVKKVFVPEGISAVGQATIEKFKGSER